MLGSIRNAETIQHKQRDSTTFLLSGWLYREKISMFKLLTEEGRAKVLVEYNTRRIVVILCALVFVILIGIVGLLPSYVLSSARQKEVAERAKAVEGLGREDDTAELRSWLVQMNKKLQVLSPALD